VTLTNLHLRRHSSTAVDFGLVSQHVRPTAKQQSHHHSEIELNFVERGRLVYLYGSREYELVAGSLALFWGSIPHHIAELDETTSMYWLTLPLQTFTRWELPGSLTQRILSGVFQVEPRTDQAGLDLAFFQRWQSDLFSESEERKRTLLLEVEARLHRMAYKAVDDPPEDQPVKKSGDNAHGFNKAQQMAGFIIAHYTQLISVKQVARAANLNPDYAMRLFRRHYQVSILEYLNRYRLAHAQRLLMATGKPIAQVALESGFGSTSQFYALFKTVLGLPPGKFRDRMA
jgi:AraC family transcriptional regulator, melibiose operon regulatory protein